MGWFGLLVFGVYLASAPTASHTQVTPIGVRACRAPMHDAEGVVTRGSVFGFDSAKSASGRAVDSQGATLCANHMLASTLALRLTLVCAFDRMVGLVSTAFCLGVKQS